MIALPPVLGLIISSIISISVSSVSVTGLSDGSLPVTTATLLIFLPFTMSPSFKAYSPYTVIVSPTSSVVLTWLVMLKPSNWSVNLMFVNFDLPVFLMVNLYLTISPTLGLFSVVLPTLLLLEK